MGADVQLVDSATTCADELAELLAQQNLLATSSAPDETFFVSDAAARFTELGARFLGRRIQAIKVAGSP